MVDWNGLLAQKYAIMQQEANDRGFGLRAAANLDATRAGLLPNESKANVAATQANTAGQLETNKYIGPLARGQLSANTANIGETNARRGLLNNQSNLLSQEGVGLGLKDFYKLQSDPLARMRDAIMGNTHIDY